jgi:hypothetical protein
MSARCYFGTIGRKKRVRYLVRVKSGACSTFSVKGKIRCCAGAVR